MKNTHEFEAPTVLISEWGLTEGNSRSGRSEKGEILYHVAPLLGSDLETNN
jgi:hypothetical protein